MLEASFRHMNALSQVIALVFLLWGAALAGADVVDTARFQSKGENSLGANRVVDATRTDGQDAASKEWLETERKKQQEAERKAKAYLVVDLTTGKTHFSAEPPNLDDDACRTTEMWLRHVGLEHLMYEDAPERELGTCPECGSHDTMGVHETVEGQTLRKWAECCACGHRFVEVFALMRVETWEG